ncbi:hypothetical protein Ddye_013083 [Dipteronia dyeriana]|uniref:Uncharacterized protein n=1 Tax=Dipteronia dyeriana TaxID=168575 RepID=A0AAD9X5S3_9ROSI|nr:hypothetical protein Ddye_013083 [Dipteronia dyeriana]
MAPGMARSSSRRNNSYKQIIKGSRSSESENQAAEASSKQDINGGCSTPKGERFRIPEILSCPPAPMKKTSTTTSSKSSKRSTSSSSSPIPFFAPPDIELFFLFAFQNVSSA